MFSLEKLLCERGSDDDAETKYSPLLLGVDDLMIYFWCGSMYWGGRKGFSDTWRLNFYGFNEVSADEKRQQLVT